jgi:predicted amidophosphoribosyltransferase
VGWRGLNTAEELARALGARWDLPVRRLLVRARGARPQRGLSRAERRANIRAAFRGAGASPPAVGLVDDVYTTGSTVSAAARELRAAGARRVHVVTFARSLR